MPLLFKRKMVPLDRNQPQCGMYLWIGHGKTLPSDGIQGGKKSPGFHRG